MNSLCTQFRGDKMRNHVLYLTPLIALEISNKERAAISTVFCPPSICVPNPEKPKNIIFSPWGHENIYNGIAQLVWTPKRSKCLFQPKWPKYPLSTLGWPKVKILIKQHFSWFYIKLELLGDFWPLWSSLTPNRLENPNFDLVIRTGWNQCHCEDYQILSLKTIHGLKSKLEWPRYHENRVNALVDALLTSGSCKFWFGRWIFKFHTFLEHSHQVFQMPNILHLAHQTPKTAPHEVC